MNTKSAKQESLKRVERLRTLSPGAHLHVIAVCGTGTAAVARLLVEQGFRVTGSDKAFYPPMGEQVKGILDQVYTGFSENNLKDNPDFVIIGNAVSPGNPEVDFVLSQGIPYASMPEVFAAFLIGERDECGTSIVVSGTHGKTTTTASIATMLDSVGLKPGFFVGGVTENFDVSVQNWSENATAKSRVVVLEGDEYDSAFFAKWPKFHSYRPDILLITSLEFDHADIYHSLEEIENEFLTLIKSMPEDAVVLVCDSDPHLYELAEIWSEKEEVLAEFFYYGSRSDSDFKLKNRKQLDSGKQEIEVSLYGESFIVESSLLGEHGAMNVLATASAGKLVGLSHEQIKHGIEEFKGVLRRQQVLFDDGKILVIEDFAHHPTAVQTTLSGIKERYPDRRLLAVFEPRSNTSRRHFFQERYAESFSAADVVHLKEVSEQAGYSKTESEFVALDVGRVITELRDSGKEADSFVDVSEFREKLLAELSDGDVVVFMSNGDFSGLMGDIVENLG